MSPCNAVTSYSSYTKGLYEVNKISIEDDLISFALEIPLSFCTKLEGRIKKFQTSSLALDGVTANLFISPDRQREKVEIIATIAKNKFSSSSLSNIKEHDFVSLGLLSLNPEKYLLDASSPSKVKFQYGKLAEGHSHTTEFTFECSKEQFNTIKDLQYIGLNGSGFYIQNRNEIDDHFYFSVHAGKNTREKTLFSTTQHPINTEFTLTLPFYRTPMN